ncbi:hypothetical protein L7F22_024244 [Adiantum nelumboides]|nr:hypothetical protein [Adiantum nelumboides]
MVYLAPAFSSSSDALPVMAMKKGCSVVMLCMSAIALITFALGIMSVSFPASSARLRSVSTASTLRSNILINVLPSFRECDLWTGRWVRDKKMKLLYTNNSCPVLTATQNCEGNGRPDKNYVKWRWQPQGCDLPQFDVHRFFRLLRGKKLAFVGDSVARNHMESLMCILWQAEVPENKGSRKMQRWYFRSHQVTIIRIWSAWLVNATHEAFAFAPANLTKLHLEQPDHSFMEFLPSLDVLVLSSGHWFAKRTAFVLSDRILGGQLWSHKRLPSRPMRNPSAFAIAMKTALLAITSHPQYKGLTIVRTYSPDHYEGGAWNTGGSCTGKTRPLADSQLVANSYTDVMRQHQLNAFFGAEKNITNQSKLRFLDITPVFAYRADAHPGPYRSRDPNKVTKRGPHGEPPPQDCLHWCMPGPIDIWNDFLLQILERELS